MINRRTIVHMLVGAVSLSAVRVAQAARPIDPSLLMVSPNVGQLQYFPDGPPLGWLLCDGRAVSRLYYRELFEVLGTSFGDGDGTTSFNLPNYMVSSAEADPIELQGMAPESKNAYVDQDEHLVRLSIYAGVK